MRRIVGLQTELVLTTALLVGAALLFGGFLLLRLTEQKLIEQQIKYVRSSVQMISYALSPNKPENQVVSREQLQQLLIELDLELNEWELFGQFMQPAKGLELTNIESLRPRPLAHQARFAPGPQLQIDYPEIWLPFKETSTGSIESAIAIQDSAHNFAGVVWLQFSLKDVNYQIAETRRLVLCMSSFMVWS